MSFDLEHTNAEGRVFYTSQAVPHAHPDRLATVATLYGMRPAPVTHCRVLELGCADGGNLLPLAEVFPHSQFVGIDCARAEIAAGQQAAAELGLENARLEVRDILDLDETLGAFDYILCHGVFSWTPRDVQDQILRVCQQHLAPHGVAYLNFNTYPGWHTQSMLRDLLRYPGRHITEPAVRTQQARRMLDLLRQALPSQGGSPVQTLLKSEAERLRQQPDGFLFHAYLDVVNTPLHFHEFVERASAAGLQYLGDAQTGLRWTPRFGDAIEQPLQRFAHDDLEREQLVDFLTDCASRYSLLCHASVALDGEPRCERLDDLFIAANLQLQRAGASWAPEQPVTCRSSTGAVVTAPSRLFNAAFALLAETGPTGLRISSLRAAIQTRLPHMPGEAWVQDLCQCYRAGWVEVHATAACYTTTVAERPRTTRWARRQAETSDHVTSLRHRLVPLGPLDRQLVRWLDGTHDVTNLDALAAEIGRQVAVLSMVDVLAVRASLSRLAAAAFFLADSAGRE